MNPDPQNESPWSTIGDSSMGSPVELRPARKPPPPANNRGVAAGLAGGFIALVLLGFVLYLVEERGQLHEPHVSGKVQKTRAVPQVVVETHQ